LSGSNILRDLTYGAHHLSGVAKNSFRWCRKAGRGLGLESKQGRSLPPSRQQKQRVNLGLAATAPLQALRSVLLHHFPPRPLPFLSLCVALCGAWGSHGGRPARGPRAGAAQGGCRRRGTLPVPLFLYCLPSTSLEEGQYLCPSFYVLWT
jgi:hypothetical protein